MSEPRFQMGLVGDRTPPPGIVADLKAFDPDLHLTWSRDEQCWVVCQRVWRTEYAGEWRGGRINYTISRDVPVLYLSGYTGEPDSRVIHQLVRQRGLDKKSRLSRVARQMTEQKKARVDRRHATNEPAREKMADDHYKMARKGHFGKSAIVAPKGGWELDSDTAA